MSTDVLSNKKLILPPPFVIDREEITTEDNDASVPGSIEIDEHGKLFRKMLAYSGFCGAMIEQMNVWYESILPEQIASRRLKLFGLPLYIQFSDVVLMKPAESTPSNQTKLILPLKARNQGLTYSGGIHVTASLVDEAGNVLETKKAFPLSKIPVMLGSKYCNLYGMTRNEIIEAGEDPHDPLGYFIFNGSERCAVAQQKTRQDKILMTLDNKHKLKSTMTCSSITSTSVVNLRVGSRKNLKLGLRMFGKSTKHSIPLFGVYNLLGIDSSEVIISMIQRFTRPEWKHKIWMFLQPSSFTVEMKENMVNYIWRKWNLENSSETGLPVMPTMMRTFVKKNKKKAANAAATTSEDTVATSVPSTSATTTKKEIPFEEKRKFIINELYKELFPHMANEPMTRRLDLLSMMACKLTEVIAGLRPIDDRDDWENKRVETAPRSIEQLFTGLWKKVIDMSQMNIDQKEITTLNEALKMMTTSVIADEFSSSFTTAFWGVKPYKGISVLRENLSEIVNRASLLAMFAQMKKINTPSSRKTKKARMRYAMNSQLGYCCFAETPEGENCGLVNYLTTTCHVSVQRPEGPVRAFINPFISIEPTLQMTSKVMFNGKFLGWCNGVLLKDRLVQAKRSRQLYKDMCIVLDRDDILHIYCDAARTTRPLLVVDQEDEQLVIDKKNLWGASFETLLDEGCIEYVDAWEQNYCYVAQTSDSIRKRKESLEQASANLSDIQNKISQIKKGVRIVQEYKNDDGMMMSRPVTEQDLLVQKTAAEEILLKLSKKRKYTYCELDPSGILSVSISIIPLPNHNQAPRNVYQAGMGKQSTGIYHSNHMNRFDSLARVLSYPVRPIFEPQINESIGLNEKPAGFNALVAIMAHPYDQEDSFVFKKEAVERGMGMYVKYTTYRAAIKALSNGADKFKKPDIGKNDNESKYAHIQANGLPMIGAQLVAGDCIIGKVRSVTVDNVNKLENVSVYMAVGEKGVVDKIYKGYNEAGQEFVKVKIRDVRRPEIGDKYSSRSAQKGTIGIILPSVDMPHIEPGFSFATKEKLTELKNAHERNNKLREQNKEMRETIKTFITKEGKELSKKEKTLREDFVRAQYQLVRTGFYEMTTKKRRTELMDEMLYYKKHGKFESKTFSQWFTMMEKLSLGQDQKNIIDEKKIIDELQVQVNQKAYEYGTASNINFAGLIPDILSNPHAIPSRMTMGKMIEFLGANAGILQGKFIDATAFRPPDIDEFERSLVMHGLNPEGKFIMYDGITGKKIDAQIYAGFIHYQALKHTVVDKIQARAHGSRTKDTRQPTGGRAIEGGIRIGEMEATGILSHGGAEMLQERLCGVSDATEMVFCTNCSSIANVSRFDKDTECHFCSEKGKFGRYTMPYVFKLLIDYLVAIGFNMKLNMVLDSAAIKRGTHGAAKKKQLSQMAAEEMAEKMRESANAEKRAKGEEVEEEEELEEEEEEESDIESDDEGGIAFNEDEEGFETEEYENYEQE